MTLNQVRRGLNQCLASFSIQLFKSEPLSVRLFRDSFSIFPKIKNQFLPIALTDEAPLFTHLNDILTHFHKEPIFLPAQRKWVESDEAFRGFCGSWKHLGARFYELQIESWIMKVFLGLINEATNGGELARSLTTSRNLSFVSADQEDKKCRKGWINIYLAQQQITE